MLCIPVHVCAHRGCPQVLLLTCHPSGCMGVQEAGAEPHIFLCPCVERGLPLDQASELLESACVHPHAWGLQEHAATAVSLWDEPLLTHWLGACKNTQPHLAFDIRSRDSSSGLCSCWERSKECGPSGEHGPSPQLYIFPDKVPGAHHTGQAAGGEPRTHLSSCP